MISNYTVTGMTCEHCVHAVTEEVGAIPGVQAAEVRLEDGSLKITSDDQIDFSLVRAAVDEAGDYSVVAA